MNRLRAWLLAAIGLLSGAAVGIDAVRRGLHRVGEDFERARLAEGPHSAAAVANAADAHPLIGRKGGAATEADEASPAARTLPGDNRFGTAPAHPQRGTAPAENTPPTPAAPGMWIDPHDTELAHVRGPLDYGRELFKRFSGDYCPAWAASLSFFSILSIAPILLCGLAVLGYIIHDPGQATAQVQHALASVLPGGADTAQRQAADIIREFNVEASVHTLYAQRGVAGVIGILSLLWAAMQIFVNASTPVNAAFSTRETRNWIKLRLAAIGLLFGAGILFLLALAPTYIAQSFHIARLGDFAAPLVAVLLVFIGIAINAVMFAVIYRYLPSPSAKVTWKAAFLAGTIVAVLWEIAKEAFAFYLSRFAHYDKVYGSLGTLIGLILWIYYTSMILLLGAEIAKLYLDAQAVKQRRRAAAGAGES